MIKGSYHTEKARKLLVKSTMRAHKLGLLGKGQFKKRHKPWNKGFAVHLSPGTEFKPGSNAMEKHPQWKGGVQNITNDVVHVMVASNVRKRRPRLVWEKYHGKIPKGHVIFHKNGDNHDDRPENLVCISRKELYRINLMKGRWGY